MLQTRLYLNREMEEDNMTVQSGPKKGEFYTLMPDIRSNWKTSGVVFENEKELLTPPRRILRPIEEESRRFVNRHGLATIPKRKDAPRS